jgi:lipoate-protein ligase A
MKIYNPGKVPWQESQLIYHALAHLGREALSLVSPATPYVCIGFHQEAEQEVDLSYCTAHDIPVFRRDLGGGAVYLDGDQLFFHLILHKDNPAIPKHKEMFYKKFLQPVIEVYRRIGIRAEYKPINDVIVETRKISGTGVGEIRDCIVFVGNLIVDFNYDMMARILKVPDEKFRDKVHKTLTENLSTIRRELGEAKADRWGETELNALLAEEFERLLGPMEVGEKDDALKNKMNELGLQMMTDDWLFQKGKRVTGRDIKIREGAKVVHKMHKAPGGLMRADFGLQDGRFTHVSLSGDFFCFPAEAIARLQNDLEGQRLEEAASLLAEFYDEKRMDTPGIGVEDWLQVLKG